MTATATDPRRAVRGGITPGHYDPDTERFTPLAPADAAGIGCPECWAGLCHTAPGWATFHQLAYCDGGFCAPGTQRLTLDEASRGHLCDECGDELDSRARDAYGRRYH